MTAENGPRAGQAPAAAQVAQVGKDRVGVLAGLAVLTGRRYLCGPAVTCACAPGDNLGMHVALYAAPPGSVIVCDGGGTTGVGLCGELLATDAANQGLAGMVIGGPIRDFADIDALGFPVLAAGTAPGQAAKTRLLSCNQPVAVGGVLVRPGDQVIADPDGAVVVPAALWPQVLAGVRALAEREESVRARLAAGERLADISGLDLSSFL
ncbi:MAG: RraA family protein [Streptosporangiaceae bacterium]